MRDTCTLQDIATLAGVHRTTVSLALRDDHKLPEATRLRIQALAKEHGYKPNPLVTALMNSRRVGNVVKHVTIAYLSNHPTRNGWRPPELDEPDFFPGAIEQAKRCGYKLEHFWMAEPGMSAKRLSDILRTRNIHGIIIGRLPPNINRLDFPWELFSCVSMGLSLESPQLHHVGQHMFFTARHSMLKCMERGYRRIGFVFSTPKIYPRAIDRWTGGYYSQQQYLSPENRIPIYEEDPNSAEGFLLWYEYWKPDALIVTRATPVIEWLRSAGHKVPEDLGIVELRNEKLELGHAGYHDDMSKFGALAVDTLLGLMHHGEQGVPSAPHEVLLPGVWMDGSTLPFRA